MWSSRSAPKFQKNLLDSTPVPVPAIFSSADITQPIVGVYFTALYRDLASSRTRLLDHTQRRATVGRTPLNE